MGEVGKEGAARQPGAAETADSAIGNIADLGEHQVLLPGFVVRRADGLCVDAAQAGSPALREFVERVFDAGACFDDLDYSAFQTLLFGEPGAAGEQFRLAADIKPFSAERQALYRGVKIAPDKSTAEYMFEAVELEVEETVPVFGPPGEDGVAPVVGEETVTRGVPTRLEFGEFVAAMWEKGVRFGIDADAVRAAIDDNRVQRVEIARLQPPTPGCDATVEERTEALHRDDAPRILPDGRMDLRQFKNRFPQVAAGVRLLQKLPRVLGKVGHDVCGGVLEPELPKDFDFDALAGEGTRIEDGAAGEFIVSARDGFINIDKQSNQLSVTEKIVSREGVSMKTTGDVALSGDEFEEHGEVQERRVVEGLHMTFHADVFGNIVSRGGRVLLKSNIAGGEAHSPGGSIIVAGRASRATLEAKGGEVMAEFAEGCTIVGSRVKVNHAVNCDILGEEIAVGVSEGCAIAGKHVRIGQSKTRKDDETIVAILVPDLSKLEREARELEAELAEEERRVAACDAELQGMLADAGFKQYLALAATIAKGGAKLSAQHEENWRKAQASFAPQVRNWQARQQERGAAQKRVDALRVELDAVADRKLHADDGVACDIAEVCGDTLVRRMAYQPDQSVVGGKQAREIASHLREFGVDGDRLFWNAEGSFSWRPAKDAPDGTGA